MNTKSNKGLIVDESPLSSYLDAQQRLNTPVAAFARAHESGKLAEPIHSHLIPLTAPKANEHYAFEVNLDQCTGCKACVAACHSLNGLDDEETWRDVGLIIGGSIEQPYQQTITTACHHCEDPGCLNGCPVLAYEKDPITGIVSHLDDQCIGCEYCVLKCPYDVPKYSEKKGIVRKCDMCHDRLEVGEAPACVQACPTEAIKITTVVRSSPDQPYDNAEFLNAFPDAGFTKPTTRYVSEKPIPENISAADAQSYRVQSAHWPLVWMLTLTQVGWGVFAINRITGAQPLADIVGAVFFFAGIFMSVSHLGRPLGAWRAFLGLRKSWLSREIVVFGQVMPLSVLTVVSSWVDLLEPYYGLISWSNVVVGAVGVFCSVMIYQDTQRKLWSLPRSAIDFYSTALLGGCVVVGLANFDGRLIASAILVGLIKLSLIHIGLQGADSRLKPAERAKKHLLNGPLKTSIGYRQLTLVLSLTFFFIAFIFAGPELVSIALLACGAFSALASEVIGRAHFFQTVDSPKMPGGLTQ